MDKKKLDLAMRAHTNLSIFEAVIGLLESGLYGGTGAEVAARRVIAACKKEQQRQLRIMDKATGRAV